MYKYVYIYIRMQHDRASYEVAALDTVTRLERDAQYELSSCNTASALTLLSRALIECRYAVSLSGIFFPNLCFDREIYFNIYIYIYIYMYTYTYACMYIYVYMFIYQHMCVCVYVHVCVCVCVCMCACVCV